MLWIYQDRMVHQQRLICSLCMTPSQNIDLEIVPPIGTSIILEKPVIVTFLLHYVAILANHNTYDLETVFRYTQIFLHMMYYISFYKHFRVVHRNIYITNIDSLTVSRFTAYIFLMLMFLKNNNYFVGVCATTILSSGWSSHLEIMHRVNAQILG
jgi:hypothetical protein